MLRHGHYMIVFNISRPHLARHLSACDILVCIRRPYVAMPDGEEHVTEPTLESLQAGMHAGMHA